VKSATLNSHASGGVGFVKGGACGLVALYFLLCAAATQAQATYYVSETGNDRDDGLSPAAPWKSLSKVSRTRFQPGDTIKFKAGETFRGSCVFQARVMLMMRLPTHDMARVKDRCSMLEMSDGGHRSPQF
jgi:hypothetical protein